MLDGFLASGGGEDWQLIMHMPVGYYDIYLYAAGPDGHGGELGSTFSINGNVKSTLTGTYYINTYVEGNQYVVYRNVYCQYGSLWINVHSNNATVANGIQIVFHSSQ